MHFTDRLWAISEGERGYHSAWDYLFGVRGDLKGGDG